MNAKTARTRQTIPRRTESLQRALALLPAFMLVFALVGCSEEDCLNCVELPAPVIPTGVTSISGDGEVIVLWTEVSYPPYDYREYNENVVGYSIYSRYFTEGDEDDPNRDFGERIDFVPWDSANYDPGSGLYWFYDVEAVNGERYEYAVASVNAAGRESDLSFELVVDAPLPMSLAPVEIFDAADPDLGDLGGFDFSALEAGRMDPNQPGTTADIRVVFADGVPYVENARPGVLLLDAGVYTWADGSLDFEGVTAAPWDGWSVTGRLELVVGHIYVAEIIEPRTDPNVDPPFHYAKFGVVATGDRSVMIHWAFQTIAGLPELSVPEPTVAVTPRPIVVEF